MFFNLEILDRQHRLQLHWPWIAATLGVNHVSKNHVLNVDIPSTCDAILRFVRSESRDPRKRLSLRLSIQLINGLVRIFLKRTTIIYDEAMRDYKVSIATALLEVQLFPSSSDVANKKKTSKKGKTREIKSSGYLESGQQQKILTPSEEAIELQSRVEQITLKELPITEMIPTEEEIARRREEDRFGDEEALQNLNWQNFPEQVLKRQEEILPSVLSAAATGVAKKADVIKRKKDRESKKPPLEKEPEVEEIMPPRAISEVEELRPPRVEREVEELMPPRVEREVEEIIPPRVEPEVTAVTEHARRPATKKAGARSRLFAQERIRRFNITRPLIKSEKTLKLEFALAKPRCDMEGLYPHYGDGALGSLLEDLMLKDHERTTGSASTLRPLDSRNTQSLDRLQFPTPSMSTPMDTLQVPTISKRRLSDDEIEAMKENMPPPSTPRTKRTKTTSTPLSRQDVLQTDVAPTHVVPEVVITEPHELPVVSVPGPEPAAPTVPTQMETYHEVTRPESVVPTVVAQIGDSFDITREKWRNGIIQVIKNWNYEKELTPIDICTEMGERTTKLHMGRIFIILLELAKERRVLLHSQPNSTELRNVEKGPEPI